MKSAEWTLASEWNNSVCGRWHRASENRICSTNEKRHVRYPTLAAVNGVKWRRYMYVVERASVDFIRLELRVFSGQFTTKRKAFKATHWTNADHTLNIWICLYRKAYYSSTARFQRRIRFLRQYATAAAHREMEKEGRWRVPRLHRASPPKR